MKKIYKLFERRIYNHFDCCYQTKWCYVLNGSKAVVNEYMRKVKKNRAGKSWCYKIETYNDNGLIETTYIGD
jgi:hypothetical protein